MADVLAMIADIKERLWAHNGDPLTRPMDQDEVHMTYYAGDLLERRGHKWFKCEGVEGACYTERAMQEAFTAGRRIGKREAQIIADKIVEERLEAARQALS